MKWLLGTIGTTVALLLAIVALTPGEWRQKITGWAELFGTLLTPTVADMLLLLAAAALAFLLLARFRADRELRAWKTRDLWWNAALPQVIASADEILFIDIYQGSKPAFWKALSDRLRERRAFKLTLLDLKTDDPTLKASLKLNNIMQDVIATDVATLKSLMSLGSPNNHSVTFGYWEGLNHGPLVFWKVGPKERAAAGFWQQIDGSTDLSPWIVTESGPVFESLKSHRDRLLKGAESRGELYSTPASIP